MFLLFLLFGGRLMDVLVTDHSLLQTLEILPGLLPLVLLHPANTSAKHTVKVKRLCRMSLERHTLAHYVSSCSWRLFSWSTAFSFSCSTFSLSCSSTIFWFSLCTNVKVALNQSIKLYLSLVSLHRTSVSVCVCFFLITPAAR